jgi:hypothetical protein
VNVAMALADPAQTSWSPKATANARYKLLRIDIVFLLTHKNEILF